jgi:acyl-CoA synthetase (AMP-forming)/AMP-acid ligase II
MSRQREVTAMLRIARAKWFVTVDSFRGFDHRALAAEVVSQPPLQGVRLVILGDPAGVDSAIGYGALLARGRDDAPSRAAIDALRPHPDAVAEIVFTSGTTGEPKGALHTHNTLMAPQLAMAARLGLQAGTVLHMASTVAHQTGFLNGIRLPLQVHGTVVLQDVWSPDGFVQLVAQHRIEVSSGSATFLLDLLRSPALERHDLGSLRLFRCGGGPIPEPLVREAEARLPGLKVVRGWGQTENGVVTMTHPDDPLELRTASDGSVQAGMEIRVVDAQDRPLPVGAEGRLQCRGASMCVGYANDPGLLAASCSGDWFDTGDLAALVSDAAPRGPAIRITGRLKDIIIRGGENIPVSYVEDILFEDPRVQEAAIVGMPDERLGERACAFVICRPGATLDLAAMRQHLAAKGVAAPYWPERLELVAQFPRSANGKVQKAALRAQLRESAKASP